MSTTNPTTQERTAVRPKYIALGVDAEGAHHVYRTVDETVFAATEDGNVEYRQELGPRGVDEWMNYVDDKRGWENQQYYTTLGAALAAGIEVRH